MFAGSCKHPITDLFDVQKVFGGEGDDAAAVHGCVVFQRTVVSDVRPHRKRHRLQLINTYTRTLGQYEYHVSGSLLRSPAGAHSTCFDLLSTCRTTSYTTSR